MDLKRRELLAKKDEAETEKPVEVSDRPLSSRLFDALFPAKRK
jgi:hypothetical protein